MTIIRLTTAWLCGVALGVWRGHTVGAAAPLAALVPLSLGWLLWRGDARARGGLAMALCLMLGVARAAYDARPLGRAHVAHLNERGVVTIRGLIAADPDRRDRRTGYRVAVTAWRGAGRWRPGHGQVLVWGPVFPLHEYGETVRVTGRLEDPPVLDGFDYRAYLARKGIHSVVGRARMETLATGGGHPVRRALLAAKGRARGALSAALPEPEAALATGILLGDARGIPRAVDEAFRMTNTTHVIAISGSNISLLVMALMAVMGRVLGPRRSVPAVLACLVLYSVLVGADAAVVRAAIMGGLMIVGRQLGRPGHATTALMAAAWAMTAFRPDYLSDLGFQLSFAATLGLVTLGEPLAGLCGALLGRRLGEERARLALRLLHEAVIVTLAAQLATWPLVAYHVGQVALSGLLANFLILPAQPALMILGALTALAGMAHPAAGRPVGAAAWLPLAYTIRTVELAARLPLAAVAWHMPLALVVAYYVALVLVAFRRARDRAIAAARHVLRAARRAGSRPPGGPAAAPAVLAGLCALVWAGALSRPDGLLHVHALDVGQGDAILVVTPNGRRMLVDGGPSPSAVLDQLGRRLAPWDRRLDVLVLTHPDADHVGGLPSVLARYRVGWIIGSGLGETAASADARAWRDAVAREGARWWRAEPGGRIVLDEAAGVVATVLWPPEDRGDKPDGDANDRSVVLRLDYGSGAVLLTGDVGDRVERELLRLRAPLRADVLKVAHHGSDTSTSAGFVAAVRPSLAVIGVGADNDFGHPAPDVLDRLGAIPVWRTDRDGAVEVLMDGRAVWVR